MRRFPGVEQHDKAFYQAFRRVELSALEPEEISTLWASVTGQPMPFQHAQAVRVLTGGNPRMIQILGGFGQPSSVRGLFADLNGLIDQHADYFRGNIEAVSGQQRRVFLALAALWRPATAGEVARQARMESSPASVELGRLVAAGRVEVVSQRGRVKRYQVAERLYTLYYLLFHGGGAGARVRALFDFMVAWYDADGPHGAWRGADFGETFAPLFRHACPSDDLCGLLAEEAPAAYRAGFGAVVRGSVEASTAPHAVHTDDEGRQLVLAIHEAAAGRLDESLRHLGAVLHRPDAVVSGQSLLIALCLALGASGLADAVAALIVQSPCAARFAPLLLALDPTRPEDEAAVEERQVAADLRARMAELRESERRWPTRAL